MNIPASKLLYAGLLIAGTISNVLLSPKFSVPVVAWIAPACLLFYFRYATLRFKAWWFILVLLVSQMIASYDVAPFPLPVLMIISLIDVLKVFLIYQLDKCVSRKSSRFITTFICLRV